MRRKLNSVSLRSRLRLNATAGPNSHTDRRGHLTRFAFTPTLKNAGIRIFWMGAAAGWTMFQTQVRMHLPQRLRTGSEASTKITTIDQRSRLRIARIGVVEERLVFSDIDRKGAFTLPLPRTHPFDQRPFESLGPLTNLRGLDAANL